MCRCAWGGDSGSAMQHWQNASDDCGDSARGGGDGDSDGDSNSDDGCHRPTGHGEGVLLCTYSFPTWHLKRGCEGVYQNPVRF